MVLSHLVKACQWEWQAQMQQLNKNEIALATKKSVTEKRFLKWSIWIQCTKFIYQNQLDISYWSFIF